MPQYGNHPKRIATRRLFIGLWPDQAAAAALAQRVRHAQALCGGRPMRTDTLHMTLAFLGAVETDRIEALCRLLRGWRPAGGELTLDHHGRFRGARIVWVGPSAPWPDWLDAMQRDLWARLEALGHARPDERFRPHVSLLRKAGPGDPGQLSAQPPILWRPRECLLVASTPREGGSYYEPLARCGIA